MNIQEIKKRRQVRRKYGIRKKISGTLERPRLTVFRSHLHIYAQIIDDVSGKTLVTASTLEKSIKDQIKPGTKKIEIGVLVGKTIAKKAIEKNISSVAFDRNGYLYHGRVKAMADAAREAGLKF